MWTRLIVVAAAVRRGTGGRLRDRRVIALAVLALVACHRHAIPEGEERITVTVDTSRNDATVDALKAELLELAAPSGPSAPAFGVRMGWHVEAMTALRGHEVDLGIYLKALRELSRPHAELADLRGDEDTLRTIDEVEKLLKDLKESLKT